MLMKLLLPWAGLPALAHANMQRIHVMPEVLASQVAAGEVVERPASVIKELIENSIDAGARRIDILVRRGGIALMRVVDDGSGMGREDAVRCLERHATSKLRTAADLGSIMTMGFRGEAMPSIASVSKFTLTTREHEAISGTEIQVEGGHVVSVTDSGEAPGTCVEVRQLFYNMPARRKFLRAEATEASHIENQVRVQALGHPGIAFSLTRDDRLLFQLPGGGGLLDRIAGLAGNDVADSLLEIPQRTLRGLTVSGWLGPAGMSRSSRALCYTFLNCRPVESPVFTHALRGGYAEALPRGQWPVVFLFITIAPEEVDVNVHPAKREVRFRDGLAVQSALIEILSDALRRLPPAPSLPESSTQVAATLPPVARWEPPSVQPELIPPREQQALRRDWLPPAVSPSLPPFSEGSAAFQTSGGRDVERPPSAPPAAEAPLPDASEKPLPFTVRAPLGTAYWLMEGAEGLVILDHRAAWERILYEEAEAREADRSEAASQGLLVPLTLQLNPREYEFLRPHLPALRRMGIGAGEFGPNTIVIDSLPPGFAQEEDTATLVSTLISDLRAAGERAPQRRLNHDALSAAVARHAARLKLPLDAAGAAALTHRLLPCDMPYCCPEGRPTLIQISFQELGRKFGKR